SRDAVDLERHFERARRNVRSSRTDVVRWNRQRDHAGLFGARSESTAAAFFAAATAGASGARHDGVPQIPIHAMDDTRLAGAEDGTNNFSRWSRHDEAHILRGLREMVRERRALRGILRGIEVVVH